MIYTLNPPMLSEAFMHQIKPPLFKITCQTPNHYQTKADLLSMGPLGTNFSDILMKTQQFSNKKIFQISPAKCWPFCRILSVLKLSYIHLLSFGNYTFPDPAITILLKYFSYPPEHTDIECKGSHLLGSIISCVYVPKLPPASLCSEYL